MELGECGGSPCRPIAASFFIVLLSLVASLPAMAAPDTVIIAGPAGTLKSNDLAFWWTGKTATPDSCVKLMDLQIISALRLANTLSVW